MIFGLIYIAVPYSLSAFLVFPAANNHQYTPGILLGLLILVWLNDTGAYVFGMLFGKHRLFERISPRKSWEGAIGGTIVTLVLGYWMNFFVPSLSRIDWIVLSLLVSVFGVYGDLFESLLKRSAGVKDSGTSNARAWRHSRSYGFPFVYHTCIGGLPDAENSTYLKSPDHEPAQRRNSDLTLVFAAVVVINFGISLLTHNRLAEIITALVTIPVFLLVVWFFRNPARPVNPDETAVYCPADGKVVVIEKTVEKEYFKDERWQVSIFMSPLNVHVNRYPVSGQVTYFRYHAGKYLVAWHPKSSELNERATVVH